MRLGKERSALGERVFVPQPRLRRRAAISLLVWGFAIGFPSRAQEAGPTQYQIKAAFLYNFVKFVEWPAQAYAGPSSPTVIGVLGENVFGEDLEKTLRSKVINHHPLEFKVFDSVMDVTNCHVLFISPSERRRFPEILGALRTKSVLTVSDSERFLQDGGMINFIIVDRRVRFQINNEPATKAGLIISSDLLNLAVPAR